MINNKEQCPLGPGVSLKRSYTLNPAKGATKNWIALEDSYSKSNSSLASTVVCHSQEERNVFAIYVSYYVKVKVFLGPMGGELSLKLPFTLMHSPSEQDPTTTEVTVNTESAPAPNKEDKPETQELEESKPNLDDINT